MPVFSFSIKNRKNTILYMEKTKPKTELKVERNHTNLRVEMGSATGDKSRWTPWTTMQEGVLTKAFTRPFYVFWELRRKSIWQVCGHLCRCQCFLVFGTAAGFKKSRIYNHLSKPTLIHNPTADLLPKRKIAISHHNQTDEKNCFLYASC